MRFLVGSLSIALIIFQLFVHHEQDWDLFYSMALADFAGWLDGWRPPVWNYLLCGGAPRLAEPQSFAFSPVFLFVLAFGPVWGLKAIAAFSMIVGGIYLYKLLSLLSQSSHTHLTAFEKSSLTIIFLLNEYFLFRIKVGHMPFCVIGLAMPLVYYPLCALIRRLSWREFVCASLFGWAFMSGGSYHAIVYFLMPAALGLGIAFFVGMMMRIRLGQEWIRYALVIISLGIVMTLPSAYRLYPIYEYQQRHPRLVDTSWDTESKAEPFFAFQLLPASTRHSPARTLMEDYIRQPVNQAVHTVWENAAFSSAPWLVLCLIIIVLRRRSREREHIVILSFTGALLVLSLLFSLGRFAPWAPFEVWNDLIGNGTRISQRFTITWSFALILLAGLLLKRVETPYLRTVLCGLSSMVMIGNAFLFSMSEYPRRRVPGEIKDSPAPILGDNVPDYKVRSLLVSTIGGAKMLRAMQRGKSMLNCYSGLALFRQPLELITLASQPPPDPRYAHRNRNTEFPLVKETPETSTACRENTFFSPTKLHLDPSCGAGTCLLIGWLNPKDEMVPLLEPQGNYYCLRSVQRTGEEFFGGSPNID